MTPEQRFEAWWAQVHHVDMLVDAPDLELVRPAFHAGYLAGAEDFRERAAEYVESVPLKDLPCGVTLRAKWATGVRALPLSPTPSREASDES